MEHPFTNELINETSPYLLQHAHNPVQWHAWGPSALAKAKQSDRPILVSIGYAACHWCHVMEKESFENEEVAAYMNEHFINIKIDREERPDLDHIYMDAVQAISGSGGWPLNVFLNTDSKPFYGGTYFPPQKAFNRPSWKDILFYIADAWKNRRDEIEQQADTLLDHINSSGNFNRDNALVSGTTGDKDFTTAQCRLINENILRSADKVYGGFGAAPKFPQTFTIQYLLTFAHHFKDEASLEHAEFSLQKMLRGGIYDHLAGGMARYSTDAQWLAPHFEKMLYDNALLVNVLCDAWQITQKEIYKRSIEHILQFLMNEMQHPEGGFFAAIDADSEGVEGKFYVWDKKEIEAIAGKDATLFCEWYGVTENGNWEGKNILHISKDETAFAAEHSTGLKQLREIIDAVGKKLLKARSKRVRPITDDKILLGWNALLLTAICKAAAALGDEKYKILAVSLFDFIKEKFSKNGEIVFHSYKNNEARHPAYLDDYAYLIQACILLQELTSGQAYLLEAKKITEYVIGNFQNPESGFFYYTHQKQTDVITRKVEIYDSAIPSGNSIMAENLLYLSVVFEKDEWKEMAYKMINSMATIIEKYPSSFGIWATMILKQAMGTDEIVITGKGRDKLLAEVLSIYWPNKILQGSTGLDNGDNFPLLRHKDHPENALLYLCKNYHCLRPVSTISELKALIKNDP